MFSCSNATLCKSMQLNARPNQCIVATQKSEAREHEIPTRIKKYISYDDTLPHRLKRLLSYATQSRQIIPRTQRDSLIFFFTVEKVHDSF